VTVVVLMPVLNAPLQPLFLDKFNNQQSIFG
jgi:hypothetical protein